MMAMDENVEKKTMKILMMISDDINAVNRYCALISSDAEIDNAVIVVVNSDVMDNRDEVEDFSSS